MSADSSVVRAHAKSGRRFAVGGLSSFVREAGEGEPVLCLHGVPASCFLYRKVLGELASCGLRGVAFDLPGLGLADRPETYDYTWSGLGRFCTQAVDALDLELFHLVVHDIGGPVGFELAAAMPERVRSLTILNTVIEADTFRRPWSMQPFAVRGIGPLWLASLSKPAFRWIMYLQGIEDRAATPPQEIDAYLELLRRGDRGRAFLKIMRGFELTRAKRHHYESAVRDVPYPVQVIWGANDPALKLSRQGAQAQRITGVAKPHLLPAKHFLQEDQAPALAQLIASQALAAR
jgi:pimeloyl-ACP methyl ester carboxylesterase